MVQAVVVCVWQEKMDTKAEPHQWHNDIFAHLKCHAMTTNREHHPIIIHCFFRNHHRCWYFYCIQYSMTTLDNTLEQKKQLVGNDWKCRHFWTKRPPNKVTLLPTSFLPPFRQCFRMVQNISARLTLGACPFVPKLPVSWWLRVFGLENGQRAAAAAGSVCTREMMVPFSGLHKICWSGEPGLLACFSQPDSRVIDKTGYKNAATTFQNVFIVIRIHTFAF